MKKLCRIWPRRGLVDASREVANERAAVGHLCQCGRGRTRWLPDRLSDTFGACRKFRILAVNDDCRRENLGLIADTRISGVEGARSIPEGRCRMAGSRQSTAACAIRASTKRDSTSLGHARRKLALWRYDDNHVRPRSPPARRPQKRAGRLSYLKATRPTDLPHPKPKTINFNMNEG